ncbi:hypothetical protein TCAP_04454, partial [Tolypocladium capitatum]
MNDEAGERQDESQHDEGEAQTSPVGAESQDKQHHRTRDVGRDGVQVRLHGRVAEPLDDLRQKQRDGLQGHAEADLNGQEGKRGGVLEDLERVLEVERLGDDRRRVNLDAVEGERFLVLAEEAGLGRARRQVPVRKDGERDGQGALDEEEVPPGIHVRLDVEDAKGEEPAEGIRDVGRGIEDGQA